MHSLAWTAAWAAVVVVGSAAVVVGLAAVAVGSAVGNVFHKSLGHTSHLVTSGLAI